MARRPAAVPGPVAIWHPSKLMLLSVTTQLSRKSVVSGQYCLARTAGSELNDRSKLIAMATVTAGAELFRFTCVGVRSTRGNGPAGRRPAVWGVRRGGGGLQQLPGAIEENSSHHTRASISLTSLRSLAEGRGRPW